MKNAFVDIPGNDTIKNFLCRIVENGKIPQLLLFAGPEGAGKQQMALAFAKLILNTERLQHPDIHIYNPEGKIGQHSIQTMREFCEDVYLAPFEAKKKVFIINKAHRMLAYSANALLKTFEEPALDSIIILISSAPDQMLPTVLSRCQIVRFQSIGDTKIAEQDSLRSLITGALAQGITRNYVDMLQLVKDVSQQLETALKDAEKILRTQVSEGFNDKMSAAQTQAIEKEVDGALCLQRFEAMQSIFDAVLSWHRDIELLHAGGDISLLINPGYTKELNVAKHRDKKLSLDKVQAAVKKVRLMLERSSPVNYCLEYLFLALS